MKIRHKRQNRMIKGKTRKVAGKLSDNPKLEGEGTLEKSTGKVQKKGGEVKKVFGNK